MRVDSVTERFFECQFCLLDHMLADGKLSFAEELLSGGQENRNCLRLLEPWLEPDWRTGGRYRWVKLCLIRRG